MSFFGNNMLTTLNSSFNERQWVEQLRKTLDEELEEVTEIPVSIFGVPKTLMIINPDSYIPHCVAIGPYHHLKPDLYDMERYKIAAAKRNQRELESDIKFQHIVDHIRRHDLRIRANYHRPLRYNDETLAWMMAVDASFLYEFLQVCSVKELGNKLAKTASRLALLTDLSGNTTAYNSILKDIIMLENQIPMFVMRMILEFQFSSQESSDEMLCNMLFGLCKELSPFMMAKVSSDQKIEVKLCAHVLDFLYQFIVPKFESPSDERIDIHAEELEELEAKISAPPSHLRQLADELWSLLSKLESGPVQWVKNIIFSKPVTTVVKLPWTIVTKIPVLNVIKGPVEHVFGILGKDKGKKDDDKANEDSSSKAKPPVLEEITIPSVMQLFEVGVKFLPTNEGIESIAFDAKTATFHIPIIDLDVNSEVVLRNLVAYEACSAKGPLVLARYTELMNGIIDTNEDAKFLCEKGIIINHLKSEKEVANQWNGMSKSVKLTKVPSLDKVIADVNKYYGGRFKVKFKKFMTKYVFGSWKILTFLATILLLLLMSLQAFCQVYSCGRLVPIKGLEPVN